MTSSVEPRPDDLGRDAGDLRRRLAEAEDDFGKPLAERIGDDRRARSPDPRTGVARSSSISRACAVGRIDLAAGDLFEQILQLFV